MHRVGIWYFRRKLALGWGKCKLVIVREYLGLKGNLGEWVGFLLSLGGG